MSERADKGDVRGGRGARAFTDSNGTLQVKVNGKIFDVLEVRYDEKKREKYVIYSDSNFEIIYSKPAQNSKFSTTGLPAIAVNEVGVIKGISYYEKNSEHFGNIDRLYKLEKETNQGHKHTVNIGKDIIYHTHVGFEHEQYIGNDKVIFIPNRNEIAPYTRFYSMKELIDLKRGIDLWNTIKV